jgi:Flp pilus assembly protein TadD
MLATFGRLPEARAAMNRAIELDPLNAAAWTNLGEYWTAGHDFSAARRALNRAQAIDPDDDDAHTGLGILDLLESRYADALAEFQKCSDEISG